MSHRRSLLMKRPSSGFTFGNALQFDGVDDVVTFTQDTNVNDTYSFSGWFKFTSTLAYQTLYGVPNSSCFAQLNNSTVRWKINGSVKTFTVSTIALNTWYHIVGSVTSLSARVYVNGVESTTGAIAVASQAANRNIDRIGQDSAAKDITGLIDEFGFWSGYGLTSGDVSTLYNSGSGASVLDVSSGNLWVAFHLNESGTDTTAVDSSVNGNDGTLTNFPASGMWVAH